MPAGTETVVYAVSADAQANHPVLGDLARRSGGEYFNLLRMGAAEAAGRIGASGLSLLSAEYDPAAIADVTPAAPRRIQGRLMVAGRLLAPEATLSLRFGDGSESRTRRFTLRQAGASTGRLVPHFWAQQRVAELSVLPERHHDELLRLGQGFGIVTPGTSLLVLETVEQYVEHRIEPPPTRSAMRAQYRSLVQQLQAEETGHKEHKLARVLEMWMGRVRWWEKEFQYREGFRVPAAGPAEEAMTVEGGPVHGPPPPPPAPRSMQTAETVMVEAAPALGVDALSLPDGFAESKAEGAGSSGGPVVVLKEWDPSTPYLKALRQARRTEAYATFLAQRREYGTSPAFFLDCADHFLRAGQQEIGLRVLGDVLELQLEEPRLLRIAAHRLRQAGEVDLAIDLFEKVLRMRPEEPQSLRDLALALEARADGRRKQAGQASPAITPDYVRAVELLNRIVVGEWDARFPGIEVVALEEANRIMALVERDPAFGRAVFPVDPRLRKLLDYGPAHRHDLGHRPDRHGPVGHRALRREVLLQPRTDRRRAA